MSNTCSTTATSLEKKKWFRPRDLKAFCKDEPRHLLAPFLPKIGVAALVGPSDCGKSTFVRQLGLSIATKQKQFLGFDLTTISGKVAYICTEDTHQDTLDVLEMQAAGMGYTLDDLDNIEFFFEVDNYLAELKDFLIAETVDLVIIDGWADVMNCNPNNNVEVRKQLEPLFTLAKKYKCCFVLLHHNVKNSENSEAHKNKINGSGAFEQKMRFAMELRVAKNNDDERWLSIVKANRLPESMKKGSYVLKLDGKSRTLSNTGKTIGMNTGAQVSIAKFLPETWVPRFQAEILKGMSIAAARSLLLSMYPGSDVPSATWYKENKDKLVGRDEMHVNDFDRLDKDKNGDIAT